jgi:hypothetical protein
MDFATYGLLSVSWNLRKGLHSSAIDLFERIRILDDVPTGPAAKMLNDAHFDRFALVIANLRYQTIHRATEN